MTTDTQSQPKEERINVRSTAAERDLLNRIAEYYGLTVSATIHFLINQAARKEGITK